MRRARAVWLPADLLLTAGAAAASCTVVLTVHSSTARIIPGLLLVLVLPGYSVSCALLPSPRPLSERALLAVGLSLSVSVVAGVVLDRAPWGLSAHSWAGALAAVTIVAAGLAVPGRLVAALAAGLRPWHATRALGRGAPIAAAIAVLIVAVAAAVALAMARAPADSEHAVGYTVLWTKPARLSGGRFLVGVVSVELTKTAYRVVALDGPRTVFEQTFELAPGRRWWGVGTIGFPPGSSVEIRVRLYRKDMPDTAYRHVSVTLPGGA